MASTFQKEHLSQEESGLIDKKTIIREVKEDQVTRRAR